MKNKNLTFWILVILFYFNMLVWFAVFDLLKHPTLEVIFFDVGQGDAIFIKTPQLHQILIDGSPTPIILEKLGEEMPFYDRTLDLIILTHPEHDHMAGLIEVLKRYRVENILWTGVIRETDEYQEWQKVIEREKKEGAEIHIAKSGQKIFFTTRPGLVDKYMEVLFPFESLEGQSFQNSNNTSIVMKLNFIENSFLFTGDIYKVVEKELLEKGFSLESDVLKVSHHGSKTSTSEEFLKEVSPQIAIILVGKDNSYGHPHETTLATLNKYDIRILRTDRDDDIKIISDGVNLIIK